MLRWISIGLWVLAVGCGGVCEFDGQVYRAGENFSDGCNTCSCQWDGSVACTDMACLDDTGDTDTDDTDTDAGA